MFREKPDQVKFMFPASLFNCETIKQESDLLQHSLSCSTPLFISYKSVLQGNRKTALCFKMYRCTVRVNRTCIDCVSTGVEWDLVNNGKKNLLVHVVG